MLPDKHVSGPTQTQPDIIPGFMPRGSHPEPCTDRTIKGGRRPCKAHITELFMKKRPRSKYLHRSCLLLFRLCNTSGAGMLANSPCPCRNTLLQCLCPERRGRSCFTGSCRQACAQRFFDDSIKYRKWPSLIPPITELVTRPNADPS